MQFDKSFTSHFVDPDTKLPITGLSGVTITILQRNDDNTYTKVVDTQACTEISDWWYQFVFSAIQDKFYLYAIYPNDDRVQPESWFVDKRLNNLDGAITDIRTGGGWANLSGISSTISNSSKYTREELKKYIDEKVWIVVEKIDNKNLDITPILDKIDEIEIPETILEEKEAKKAIKLIQGVDKKLTSYIESEINEKKQEDEKEIEIESLKNKLQEKESLIEKMEETAQEIIGELEKEKENAKSMAKKDIISSLSE